MREKNVRVLMVGALFLVVLVWGMALDSAADAADIEKGSHRFVLELTDGSMITGKIVFEINLLTRYGRLRVRSSEVDSIAYEHNERTATVVAEGLSAKGKVDMPELRLETITGALVIRPGKIRRLSRAYVSPPLGKDWVSLLSDANLKAWKGPALPPGKDGILRMTTRVNVWGAVYTGNLPERYELTMDVKFTAGARMDVHVRDGGGTVSRGPRPHVGAVRAGKDHVGAERVGEGTVYVRVSTVAKDKAGQWVNVRFVCDRGLKAYVDGKEAPLSFWGQDRSPIALCSDFAEGEFRNIAVRAKE